MPKKKKSKYQAIIETSGEIYKAENNTVHEAIEDIGLTWDKISHKGVVTIKKDKLKAQKLFPVVMLRRLFSNKEFRLIQSRFLQSLLK